MTLSELSGFPLRLFILCGTGLAFLCFGYDQGVVGGVLTVPNFLKYIGNPSPNDLSTVTSIYQIGCVLGCILAAIIGLRLGRRWTLILGCTIVTIGGTLQAANYSFGMMVASRIIAGVGTGLNTGTVPVYVAEMARATQRGRDIAIQLNIVIGGVAVAYWVDYGMIKHWLDRNQEFTWRFPIALQDVFMILAGVIIYFCPESPHILMYRNQKAAATHVLARVRGVSDDDPEVLESIRDIEIVVELEKSVKTPWYRIVFWDKSRYKNHRRAFLIFVVQAFQQLGGNNTIVYYQSVLINTAVTLPANTGALLAGALSMAYWVGSFTPIWTLDRFGRRTILLWGSVTTLACIAVFTAGVAKSNEGSVTWGWISIGSLFFYYILFASSWAPAVWVLGPELSPLEYRHINASIGAGSEWIFTFVTVKSTPPALASIGYKIYLIYSILIVAGFFFVYFCIPETNGLTLEQLDDLYNNDTWFLGIKKLHFRTPAEIAAAEAKDPEALHSAQLKASLEHHENSPQEKKLEQDDTLIKERSV